MEKEGSWGKPQMNKWTNIEIMVNKLKTYKMAAVSVTAANILIFKVPLKLDRWNKLTRFYWHYRGKISALEIKMEK